MMHSKTPLAAEAREEEANMFRSTLSSSEAGTPGRHLEISGKDDMAELFVGGMDDGNGQVVDGVDYRLAV
jgi:hypothetical protein